MSDLQAYLAKEKATMFFGWLRAMMVDVRCDESITRPRPDILNDPSYVEAPES